MVHGKTKRRPQSYLSQSRRSSEDTAVVEPSNYCDLVYVSPLKRCILLGQNQMGFFLK